MPKQKHEPNEGAGRYRCYVFGAAKILEGREIKTVARGRSESGRYVINSLGFSGVGCRL